MALDKDFVSQRGDYDFSWYHVLPRYIPIQRSKCGLRVARQKPYCFYNLGDRLQVEGVTSLHTYWHQDKDLYIKLQCGLSVYSGPQSV